MPARRNLVTNPSFEVNTTGWAAVRGTLARIVYSGGPGPAFAGTCFGRYTANGTAGGNYVHVSPTMMVSAGDVVTGTIQLRASAGSYSLDLIWLNADGGVISTESGVAVAATLSWQPFTNTKTVPAGAAAVQFRVLNRTGTMAAGAIFEVDGALFERAGSAGEYFDGDSDLSSARCEWLGAAHASISQAVLPVSVPSDHLRLEVAFSSEPDSTSPTWEELTDRLDLTSAVTISRGRQDEFSVTQPSTCSLALDNSDGALTAGNAGSPFYPDVLPMRKLRVSYRDPDVSGNFLSEAASSMEAGVALWTSNTAFGTKNTALGIVASGLHVAHGFQSGRADWPNTVVGSAVWTQVTGLTIGRTYTASAYVYVPAGSPDVRMECILLASGPLTSVKDQLVRVSVTFTATLTTLFVGIGCASATAGTFCYFDAVQVDEGSSVVDYTTEAPPISYRFTGYVEEWPVEWPGGGDYSEAKITATDRLARIGGNRPLRSVIEEAILTTEPRLYYPLGEAETIEKAGDISGTFNTRPLSIVEYGAPGASLLTFGTATGPPTDGMPAPTFDPINPSNGRYLAGRIPNDIGMNNAVGGFVSGVSLRACFLTSLAASQVIARVTDFYGFYVQLSIDGTGRVVGTEYSPWDGVRSTVTSLTSFADGNTHDACITIAASGDAILYVDGVQLDTDPYVGAFFPAYTWLTVGGSKNGLLFEGTISHVAAHSRVLASTEVAEIAVATTTGFEGDTSDERIARYAGWAGVPAGELVLDAGSSQSICFTDTTDTSVATCLQDVAQTEGGRLFTSGKGELVFHARSRAYANPDPTVVIDAGLLGEDTRFTMSTQELANDIVGKRPTGPDVRSRDLDSISLYGQREDSLTLLVTDDEEVADAVNWRLGKRSKPLVKLPSVTLDVFSPLPVQVDLIRLELGDRVQATGLPDQAPASSLDFIAEGYSESISLTGWSLTANLSNYSDVQALVLDDAVYGLLDGDNRLIY